VPFLPGAIAYSDCAVERLSGGLDPYERILDRCEVSLPDAARTWRSQSAAEQKGVGEKSKELHYYC
jgi:hypothetical protein